jgi:hypothetical protein
MASAGVWAFRAVKPTMVKNNTNIFFIRKLLNPKII